MNAPLGIHPKWISCFPEGQYFGWDGVSEDPHEDDEAISLLLYRDGSPIEEIVYSQLSLDEKLKRLGV
jgi:hypothetical protein